MVAIPTHSGLEGLRISDSYDPMQYPKRKSSRSQARRYQHHADPNEGSMPSPSLRICSGEVFSLDIAFIETAFNISHSEQISTKYHFGNT